MHWSILQLMEVWDQFITTKQMNGVIILQVDKVNSREEAVLRLFDFVENEQTQKALLQFESTVTTAITMRIRKVAKHFRNLLAFGWLSARKEESFRLPDCVVTAFYLKPGGERKSEKKSAGFASAGTPLLSSAPPFPPLSFTSTEPEAELQRFYATDKKPPVSSNNQPVSSFSSNDNNNNNNSGNHAKKPDDGDVGDKRDVLSVKQAEEEEAKGEEKSSSSSEPGKKGRKLGAVNEGEEMDETPPPLSSKE